MEILCGTRHSLPCGIANAIDEYRHEIFVTRMGWGFTEDNTRERDQFDHDDTVYLAAQVDNRIVGCARLLPTTQPYLLGEVFPELLKPHSPPQTSDVWELSRFAATDPAIPAKRTQGRWSSHTAVALVRHSLAWIRAQGATRLISVSPKGVERLLRHAGFTARRAGDFMDIEGEPIFACWIGMPPKHEHGGLESGEGTRQGWQNTESSAQIPPA